VADDDRRRDALLAELELRRRQLDAVRAITAAVYSTTDIEELIRHTLDVTLDVARCQAGSLILFDRDRNRLVIRHAVGPRAGELLGEEMLPDQGIAGRVFRTGRIEASGDVQSDPDHYRAVSERIGLTTETMVTLPLKQTDGETIGVMQVLNRDGGPFTPEDLDVLLILATHAAMVIDNARLHHEARLAQVATLVGEIAHDVKNYLTPVVAGVSTFELLFSRAMADVDEVCGPGRPETSEELADGIGGALCAARDLWPEIREMVHDGAARTMDRAREIADCIKGEMARPVFAMGNVNQVIRGVAKVLGPLAERNGLLLDLSGLGAVPDIPIDAKRLDSAIYNLTNNAIPETPPGGTISIRTSARPDGPWPEGGWVEIVVEDTGRGMAPAVLQKLFTRDAVSTKSGGTGLGTRIVKNAVDAHNGTVRAQSELGRGTRFTLRLPMARAQ
jgi:signal transduction histidine kinase